MAPRKQQQNRSTLADLSQSVFATLQVPRGADSTPGSDPAREAGPVLHLEGASHRHGLEPHGWGHPDARFVYEGTQPPPGSRGADRLIPCPPDAAWDLGLGGVTLPSTPRRATGKRLSSGKYLRVHRRSPRFMMRSRCSRHSCCWSTPLAGGRSTLKPADWIGSDRRT